MIFVILTNKTKPDAQPLMFILPDQLADVDDDFPAEVTEKYNVHCIMGDEPSVCGSHKEVLDVLAEEKDV